MTGIKHIIGLRHENVAVSHYHSAVNFSICFVLLAVIFIGGCINSHPAHAFSDQEAIKAVIGEAENQGYKGMAYVSCAIRNRGTLQGVYGIRAPRVKKHLYSQETYKQATEAWQRSKVDAICKDIQGATNWENITAFGKPYWTKGMVETLRYKDHVFYVKARITVK